MGVEPRYLGHYKMLECIAHGGMGEVWKAVDTHLQRMVAIKLLLSNWRSSAGFVARFQSEAQLIASLRHPNIINIHNFYIEERPGEPPLLYMVMDYVEGQTMARYLAETSRLGLFPPAEDIIYLFSAVALALDYAHRRGMIHRDIKPANILLDQRDTTHRAMGVPIITDFGIARRQGVSGGTIIGTIVGTPLYVAPEQALGMYEEKRSDLYSLGIILYETLTGIPPFRGEGMMNVIMQHINHAPTPPELLNPDVSPEVSAVILKSISKKPEDRFSSASEMVMALAEAFNVPVPETLLQSLRSTPSLSALSLSYIPLISSDQPAPEVSNTEHLSSAPTVLPTEVSGPGIRSMVETDASSRLIDLAAATSRQSAAATPGPTLIPAQESGPLPPSRQPRIRLKRPLWMFLSGLAVVVVMLGIVARFLFFTPPSNPTVPQGTVQFTRSATSKQYNQLQVNMKNVPDPPAGKAYYAWIDAPANESHIPHWRLQAQQKQIHSSILSDNQVANLLTPDTLFLITLEDASNPHLLVPAIDPRLRLYYAEVAPPGGTSYNIKVCPSNINASPCV
ncbi:serine/threonine protein kinase [Dictyobacter kobayashii]|uniref:non-specific serine/threonine protein kinase n=1 Tax=Dictyobacter kobayashii TaxID=2014872 RepID=A0A402AFL6_9CHLR|nr:serine/threonine-protein kinase [Dictyobacter kobayashii]GCE17875.1 hypothetical protein KDK_16750 [Dictyobacter kobayashii]